MAGGSSFSSCATTRPPSASHIQRSFSETLSCSTSAQVKSQSQPQSPEFRRGRASLPVSPCRLPMKKRKFDWGHLNETSDESNQSAAARSPIVGSCSASPSCPQKLLSRKFDSQFSASLSGYTQAPPVFEYQMSSHDHDRQKPSATNREVEMPLTLPSGYDYRPRGISVCLPQQAVTDDSDHILYTADQMKRRSGVQIPSLDSSNSQGCLTNTETNSEERTPIAKSAAKSRLSLLVRSLTPSSNAPRTSAERDRSPLTTHLHNYSEKPHALAQAQIAASSSLRSVPNLPVTSTLTCVDRSPTDPPSTQFDSCINKWRQETQTFSLISTLSSALDTSQPTTMHSARDESRVHGTSVTNEDIILKFSPGHQSSASSVSDVAVHNHLHTLRDTKTPLFEHISSPDTAVSQSLPNLHTPQMSTSDHIAHRDSTLDAAASVMGVTSGKQLSTPQQPETAKPLVLAASTAAGAERPSLDQSSASSSLHTALTTNANLHSNEFRDLRHKLPEDLPSNARILMVLSPTRHAANLSVTDVNRSHTVNSELNGSSIMRALNGSKSGFPLILVSASSSAGAAALAAAAALASGAPPTSLVPVPVQLTTYVPPTTRSAPHSFASPDAYPKETTDVPHRNQRLIISLCNPPISSTNECSQRQPHPRLHGESPLRESHLGAVRVDVAPPNVTVSPAVAMTHPRA
ncbi:unnamed protein product [Dicrocoelium dendriticum]|nr:unnamed protein product [Dicrocoelium dendriticum]